MNAKTITMGIVGITVAVLITMSVAAPILAESVKTEDTFTNDGFFTYDAVGEGTDVTISFDPQTPNILTIGDSTITMPSTSSGVSNWTICGSENFTVRYYISGTTANLQCYGVGGYIAGDSSATTQVVTVNVTDSSVVFNRNSTTNKTYTMGTHGFVINAEGNGSLMLKYPNESAYVKDDSDIYLCGTTFVTGSGTNDYVGVFGYGSIDDGITLSSFYGNTNSNTVSFGDAVITSEEVDTHIDLYKIEKVVFPLTQNSATVNATYSYFVIPTEVTAERSVHPDATTIEILEIIPIMVLIAIVLATIGLVMFKRNQ